MAGRGREGASDRGRGKGEDEKRGGTWLGLGEAATHGEWPEDGWGAGTQAAGCGRPRVPPEGLDPPRPLEMLELPSQLELPAGRQEHLWGPGL